MSTGTSKPAPDVLLCERCGYVLSGLPVEATCPECGKAIAESLPSVRTLAYEPKRGMGWVRVAVRMVRSPLAGYETVTIDVARARGFAMRSFAVVGVMAGLAALMPWVYEVRARGVDAGGVLTGLLNQALRVSLLVMLGAFVLLWLVMLIERAGSRMIGLTHRWRITSEVAYCVCAYASVGWIIGGLAALVWSVVYACRSLPVGSTVTTAAGAVVTRPRGDDSLVLLLGVPVVFLIGLFGYELLVYIGLRRCKFANVEGAR
ncbi:MAG: hypothetical protein IBJ18_01680 [Phycisphaerales bacterium]|nr:hypothetical protein [Phycisphaerales bacterium]